MRNNITTYLLFTLFSVSIIQSASAQNKIKRVTDGNTFMVDRTFFSDTLLIECDTIYILNKPTFNIFEAAYNKWRTKSKDISNLVSNYDILVAKQEQLINSKEEYYQNLKSKFDSLVVNSNVLVQLSNNNISQISSSLGKASDKLVETHQLLSESQKLLEEERKNNWKRTLKVGIGGFTVGITVGLLLFLVAK